MTMNDLMIESLEESIQTVKQLIAQADARIKKRPDAMTD